MQSFYDEATGLFDVYLLKYKSESLKNFKQYMALCENQANCRLKIIHTDGAFSNWDDYCRKRGIVHKVLLPYTPEQNGRAEHFNRTVMRPVRSILYKKKLSKFCWGEITHGVIHTLNQSPLDDDFKSTFECLQGKKSYLGHLKILECQVWVHIPKEKRKKLNEYTWQGILVEYDFTNQYHILNPHTGKVYITQDAHFNELHMYNKKELLSADFKDEE